MTAEGVTSGEPSQAEPPATQDAMHDDSIAHEVGTRGLEPTGAGKQR
jgi:hypothetical protein